MEEHGLKAADIFLQIHERFAEFAVNHPETKKRAFARDQFFRVLDYANAAGADHITVLPGVTFKSESRDDSVRRTIDFPRLLVVLNKNQFTGWIALEFVWIDWEHCNEVDIVSESIQLKKLLETAAAKIQ